MSDINISNIVKTDLCTGCGTCTSFCPVMAIQMNLNRDKGIFLPLIDKKLCNNCGICYSICPGHEVDFNSLNMDIFGKIPENSSIGDYTDCYIGYAIDEEIRFNSSSGGLITQFLIFALKEKIIDGALVTRMSKENPLIPEPFIARTKEEIIEASTSKYCPVPTNIALKQILEAPENEKFAVVGLPCHVHGIRKAEKTNRKLQEKIKIHLGIMCGTTKTFNATNYQLGRMKISKCDVREINYRGEGWPGKLKIKLNNNQVIEENYLNYYDGEFSSFFPWRCTLCADHVCELSDISFGDAWIDKIKKKDTKGTSIVVNRKKVTNTLLEKMQESNIIKLVATDSKNVAISQNNYNFKKKKIDARFKIVKLLGQETPIYNQKFINAKFSDYLISIWLYFWIYISTKKYSWKLLRLRKIPSQIFMKLL